LGKIHLGVTMDKPLIAVSGGFDPVHIGHIRMIRDAARYGDVLVIINSDEWLEKKKGYVFMPWKERAEIMGNIKGVVMVTSVDDSDGTVCEALVRCKPHAFANGGDRKEKNTPEMDLCEHIGIEMMWAIGGNSKPQSSSWLVNKLKEKQNG
jgi:D-beta-D-heptose 7-phosphate kinase/D-beta-D-heptose 1-phosphate adenosyltransferase